MKQCVLLLCAVAAALSSVSAVQLRAAADPAALEVAEAKKLELEDAKLAVSQLKSAEGSVPPTYECEGTADITGVAGVSGVISDDAQKDNHVGEVLYCGTLFFALSDTTWKTPACLSDATLRRAGDTHDGAAASYAEKALAKCPGTHSDAGPTVVEASSGLMKRKCVRYADHACAWSIDAAKDRVLPKGAAAATVTLKFTKLNLTPPTGDGQCKDSVKVYDAWCVAVEA